MKAASVIDDRYRLCRRIYAGSMGEVWQAHHERLDRTFAIKLLAESLSSHEASRSRFRREAKVMAQIRSAHVVQVLDFGEIAGRPYIAMEYLEGRDLRARLKGGCRPELREVARIARGVASGLTCAHALGFVHRDLKPGNLFLVGDEGPVKILDFGVAKETSEARLEEADATAAGQLLGSPQYMSPEQARGATVDRRTDLWSLAVILYQALVGRRPFTGPYVPEVLYAICTEEPAPPTACRSELGAAVDAFFARALCKSPAGRFGDVTTFGEAFDRALTASAAWTAERRLDETDSVALSNARHGFYDHQAALCM